MFKKTKTWISHHGAEIKVVAWAAVSVIGLCTLTYVAGWSKGYSDAVNKMADCCRYGVDYIVNDPNGKVRYIMKFATEELIKN